MDAVQEQWRAVPSVPGLLASSFGRVMVAPYTAPLPNGGLRQYGGFPTYGQPVESEGRYITVFRRKTYKVHSLVCEAFNGPRPEGLVCCHVDEDWRNNLPSNLEWGTQRDNLNAPGFIAYCRSRTGANNPLIKGRASKALPA